MLEIDGRQKRISLGKEETEQNPWDVLAETYPPKVKGTSATSPTSASSSAR